MIGYWLALLALILIMLVIFGAVADRIWLHLDKED